MIFPIIGGRKKLLHISTHDAMHAINLKKCLKCTSDTVELPFYNSVVINLGNYLLILKTMSWALESLSNSREAALVMIYNYN